MYPPAQYARLPTEEGDLSLPPSGSAPSKLRRILSSRSFLRTAVIGFGLFLLVLVFGKFAHNFLGGSAWTTAPRPTPHMKEDWTDEAFRFKNESKPLWLLDPPAGGPLVLNIAVISRVDEFERRKDIREAIFEGVRPSDVKFEYRFFVGAPKDDSEGKKLHSRLLEENKYYNDVEILENIPDIPERISEKRYAAFKWSGEMPSKEYDYFFTLDSDTFVRLGALARRMPVFLAGKNIKPREQPILIGRMSVHWVHFYNTVPDGNKNAIDEDEYIRGPWYEYPMGIGYMISSSLVDTFLSTNPPLPHHIHYPSDDVMIGTWISALRLFPNQTIEFETTDPHLHDEPVHKVIPPPYLPHVVDTNIIDDKEGWHNFVGRHSHDDPVSWSSVCVHKINGDEMRVLRRMEYIRDEWEDSYDISV